MTDNDIDARVESDVRAIRAEYAEEEAEAAEAEVAEPADYLRHSGVVQASSINEAPPLL